MNNLLDFVESIIIAILGLIGLVIAPVAGYFLGKRKTNAEVLLIDMGTVNEWNEAVKSWEEQRKSLIDEIAKLHVDLDKERERRRAGEKKHREEVAALNDKVDFLEAQLGKCRDCLDLTD